jgi:glycine betaine catabolism A
MSPVTQVPPAPVDRGALLQALEPLGRSRTLPSEAYLSPDLFTWEIDHIFTGSWLCLGRIDGLIEAGQARALSAGRARLLLVRDTGGELRGFHNTCRHRGHELLPEGEPTSVRQLRCPYHSWTYALDGSLRSAPSFTGTPGFDQGEYPLIQVGLEERYGWLFVNTEADSEKLGAHLGNLDEILDPYQPGRLIEAARHEYVVGANWKLLVENYHECYHCTSIHPALCKVSPPDSGVDLVPTGRWCGGPMDLADHAETMSFDGRSHGVTLPGLDPQRRRQVLYVGLFPNLLISAHPDYVMTHRLTPLAVDRTHVECLWLFPPEALQQAGFGPAYAVDFWDVTNREDWSACEGVQRGLSGGAYVPGPLSTRESTLHQFYAMVGNAYLATPVLASPDAAIPR